MTNECYLFILAIICANVTVAVNDTNSTTTTETLPVTNGTTKYVNSQNTTTTNAPTNINVTEAIVYNVKGKVVFNNTKAKAIMRNNDNTPKVYSNDPAAFSTEVVTFPEPSTSKPWSTDQSNVLKIANELNLLERLTAILPSVLDEKMNNNKNSANETAKKDLEVFEQYSLSHYLDPEAEVVVFRKNERSQRQISDMPPQNPMLYINNKTEKHVFKLVPQMKNYDAGNNSDKTDRTVYEKVDGTGMLISDAQIKTVNNDNRSQKLIPDAPKSDFNPILHLSQCNSCIASLNQINWNWQEPIKTENNQQFDLQSYPLQIPNTDMFNSQNTFDSEKENYIYLSPALYNPHILQGYRRNNHINQNFNTFHNKHMNSQIFRTRVDNPSPHHGIKKVYNSRNKDIIESNVGTHNSIFLDVERNPYGQFKLIHPMPNKISTNVPELNNMYPWLEVSSPSHSALRSQPLPPIHSLLLVNEPESEIAFKSATPSPVHTKTFSQLTVNKDKFDYYDSLINMISKKTVSSDNEKRTGRDVVNVVYDTSVKDAANDKLVLKMNEFRQNLGKLKELVDGQEWRYVEKQQLLLDKKIESEPSKLYLRMSDTITQSDEISRKAETNIADKTVNTARKEFTSANANLSSKTLSTTDKTKPESNKNVTKNDFIQIQFEIPPMEIDVSKRRAMDSKIQNNLQRELTEPLSTLIKLLLQANKFDQDKIEQFWPYLVAPLISHMAYLPTSAPFNPSSPILSDNVKLQNTNMLNLSTSDNTRNVNIKDLSTLNESSNVMDREHAAQYNGSSLNNETRIIVNYNVTDSVQNTLQSLLASHNITNNSDTISVSTTILLDVTDNDTRLDPKNIRRRLEIIKIENNANNASVLLLNKKNYDEILKSLDSFTLERKKAYVTVVPTEKATESLDIGRSKYNRTMDPTFLDKIFGNQYVSEKEVTIGPAREELINTKDLLDNPQVFSALKKQTELMGKLLLKLKGESARKNAGKDFQDLIKEVEAKKHGTYTTEVIEDLNKRIGDETKTPPTTVMTMIDETEVRKALRNSPYVKRILKLSKQKRDRYIQGKKASERKKH